MTETEALYNQSEIEEGQQKAMTICTMDWSSSGNHTPALQRSSQVISISNLVCMRILIFCSFDFHLSFRSQSNSTRRVYEVLMNQHTICDSFDDSMEVHVENWSDLWSDGMVAFISRAHSRCFVSVAHFWRRTAVTQHNGEIRGRLACTYA